MKTSLFLRWLVLLGVSLVPSLLQAASVNPTEQHSCRATYSAQTQTAYLPCVAVVDASGSLQAPFYAVEMQQVPQTDPVQFSISQMVEVEAWEGVEEDGCRAMYRVEEGVLEVPCVDVLDSSGKTQSYVVHLRQTTGEEPLQFVLNTVNNFSNVTILRNDKTRATGSGTVPGVWPLPSSYQSFGSLKFCDQTTVDGKKMVHVGIDIMTRQPKVPVYSVCEGTVVQDNTDTEHNPKYKTLYAQYWNSFLIIKHNCGGNTIYGYYGHLRSVVKKDNKVSTGTLLGHIRESYNFPDKRNINNDHLHFGINTKYVIRNWGYEDSCEVATRNGWKEPLQYFSFSTALTLPATPAAPTVTPQGTNTLQISWNAVSGAASYGLWRSTSPNGSDRKQIYCGKELSRTDTGSHLSANTTYYYQVRAGTGNDTTFCQAGANGSTTGWSAYSAVASGKTAATTPTPLTTPAAPTVTTQGTNSLQISWNAVSGAASYGLWRSTSSSGSDRKQIYCGNGLSYTDTGNHLSANTTYYYQLRAGTGSDTTFCQAGANGGTTGWSAYSAIASGKTQATTPTLPATPAAPTVTPTGTNSLQINWNAVSGTASYGLWRSTSSSGSDRKQIYCGNGLSYTDTGNHLSANTTYYYQLRAGTGSDTTFCQAGANGGTTGWSAYSAIASGKTQATTPTLPATPAAPTVTPTGTNSLQINWNAVSGTASYGLWRSTSSSGSDRKQIYCGNGLSYTDTGNHLSANTTYYYQLRAGTGSDTTFCQAGANGGTTGWSAYSAIASGKTQATTPTLPATPTAPTVTPTGTNSLQINWNAVSGTASYGLWRSTSSSGSDRKQIYCGKDLSYTDTGSHLSANTTYYYQVRAGTGSDTTFCQAGANGGTTGWSGYSAVASGKTAATTPTLPTTPAAPTVTSTGPNSLQISWNVVSGTASYGLWRSTSSSGSDRKQIYCGKDLSYTDTGSHLSANTTYYYQVRAGTGSDTTFCQAGANGGTTGWSGYSAVASGKTAATTPTLPTTPAAPTVTSTGPNSLQISWNVVSGTASYGLWRSTSSSGSDRKQIYCGKDLSYTDTGSHLSANTTYYYQVRAGTGSDTAFCQAGANGGTTGWSGYSAVASGKTQATTPTLPTTPAAPTVTSTGPNSLQISWNAISGTASYGLWRSTSSSGSDRKQIYCGKDLSYTDTGSHLSANTTYYYQVRAGTGSDTAFCQSGANGGTTGWSDYSAIASGKTQATTPTLPATPAAPTVTPTGPNSLQISWNAISSTTSYGLWRSTSSSGSDRKQVYCGKDLSYTDTGSHLSANTTYYYQVRAGTGSDTAFCQSGANGDTTGWSVYSAVASSKTQPPISIKLSVTSNNGLVTSSPAMINCGNGNNVCSADLAGNTLVTLTAMPNPGFNFTGWSGDCQGTASCQLTMTGTKQVTALFNVIRYPLTVTANNGGVVTSNPAGINCGNGNNLCNANFDANTLVTLTSSLNTGFTFDGWNGDCGGKSCQLTMNAAKKVTAQFSQVITSYQLNVTSNNGLVTSSPAGINCGNGYTTCNANFTANTIVTLTANPSSGFNFTGWNGDCYGTYCQLTMNGNKNVNPQFTMNRYRLTVTPDYNGTVTSSPSGIDCGARNSDCTEDFNANTPVTLTATPNSGFSFVGWGGSCWGNAGCQVVMNGTQNVSVQFKTNTTVSSVYPQTATLNQPTTFTVQGNNLPDSTAFFIADCANLYSLGGNSTQRQFQCTPSYSTGYKWGVVKDQSGGKELFSFNVNVQGATPVVTSVSPTTAMLNQPTTFTVQGSNLPDTTAFFIADCANLYSLGGNSTQRQFQCTPSYSTGYKWGVVKNQAGGTELRSFGITVQGSSSGGPPTVTSVSPESVYYNQSTVFTVKGTNLPDSTAFYINYCASLISLGGNANQRQFQCTPRYNRGWQWGVVKDKSGGNVLREFWVYVW